MAGVGLLCVKERQREEGTVGSSVLGGFESRDSLGDLRVFRWPGDNRPLLLELSVSWSSLAPVEKRREEYSMDSQDTLLSAAEDVYKGEVQEPCSGGLRCEAFFIPNPSAETTFQSSPPNCVLPKECSLVGPVSPNTASFIGSLWTAAFLKAPGS